jgi:GH25 family lysozyme M1 (1,4-beta-N-acetylmuramidase)
VIDPITLTFEKIEPDGAGRAPPARATRGRIFALSYARSFAALAMISLVAVACGTSGDKVCNQNASPLNVCPKGATVKGVDVSKYDPNVNWASAKAAKIVFAFARVSDGLNYPDATFLGNWDGMKQQGIVRGVYQYFRSSQDPIKQADYMLAQLAKGGAPLATDLPPVMDIETADGVSTTAVRAAMQKWLDYVELKTGRKPLVYTANFMSATIGPGFSKYPLWVANYGAQCPLMPDGWTTWKFWQYDDKGTVPGVGTGNVDVDEFDGTLQDLLTFAQGPSQDGGVPTTDGGAPADGGLTDGGPRTDSGTPDTAPDPCAR